MSGMPSTDIRPSVFERTRLVLEPRALTLWGRSLTSCRDYTPRPETRVHGGSKGPPEPRRFRRSKLGSVIPLFCRCLPPQDGSVTKRGRTRKTPSRVVLVRMLSPLLSTSCSLHVIQLFSWVAMVLCQGKNTSRSMGTLS